MNFKGAAPNTSGPPRGDEVDLVSTHQRLLIAAALRTEGEMIELGCGWYSTPLLHELALATGRRLWTLDNQPYWLPQFADLEHNLHRIVKVGWWPEMWRHFPPAKRYGLVFVDQGQPIEREYTMREFLEREKCGGGADVYVLHDTEEGVAYGYNRLLPELEGLRDPDKQTYRTPEERPPSPFKYQWTDRSQAAWTTVASNHVDVTKWGLVELKARRLTEDIT